MRIREVNTFSDFMALKGSWNDVLKQSNHTVFQTWEWLSTWWKYFGKGKRLLILLAEENNVTIGIAPLMYSVDKMFGVQQGKIEFIGYEHSPYNNFIFADKQEECIKLFVYHLNNLHEKWNYAKLVDIPENADGFKALSNISKVSSAHRSFYTLLPNSQDTLLEWINRKDRKELRRNLRRLEDDSLKASLEDYSEPKLVTAGLKTLMALHQDRWKVKGGFSGMFLNPQFGIFVEDIASCFAQKGWLGLYSLELSGKPVGSLLGFKYNSKYYAYLEGLDSAYLKYSIGNLLFIQTMAKCIQEGIVEFDFLWGTDFYKKKFNPILKQNENAIIVKKGHLSNLRYSIYTKYWNGGTLLNHYFQKYYGKKLN